MIMHKLAIVANNKTNLITFGKNFTLAIDVSKVFLEISFCKAIFLKFSFQYKKSV